MSGSEQTAIAMAAGRNQQGGGAASKVTTHPKRRSSFPKKTRSKAIEEQHQTKAQSKTKRKGKGTGAQAQAQVPDLLKQSGAGSRPATAVRTGGLRLFGAALSAGQPKAFRA